MHIYRLVNENTLAQIQAQGKTLGWKRGLTLSDAPIADPNYGVALHIAVFDEKGNYLYDSLLRAERGGAVFIPWDGVRIGLLEVFRPLLRDNSPEALEEWKKNFPACDLSLLGRPSLELPRNYPVGFEPTSKTAERSKLGGKILSCENLGTMVDNTANSPHETQICIGTVDIDVTDNMADPNAKLVSRLQWYAPGEIRELVTQNKIVCGFTLGALFMAAIKMPALRL